MEIIDILFKREFKCMNNIIGLIENLDIGKYDVIKLYYIYYS